MQLGGFAFIGEGIPIGLGAAYRTKYAKVGCSCPSGDTGSVSSITSAQLRVERRLAWGLGAAERCRAQEAGAETPSGLQVSGHDDSADQVCCSFFGDGTANIGALPRV